MANNPGLTFLVPPASPRCSDGIWVTVGIYYTPFFIFHGYSYDLFLFSLFCRLIGIQSSSMSPSVSSPSVSVIRQQHSIREANDLPYSRANPPVWYHRRVYCSVMILVASLISNLGGSCILKPLVNIVVYLCILVTLISCVYFISWCYCTTALHSFSCIFVLKRSWKLISGICTF